MDLDLQLQAIFDMPKTRSHRKPLIGLKFGLLEITALSHQDRFGHWYYECKCKCGNTIVKRGEQITSGHTRSCGCLRKRAYAKSKYNQERFMIGVKL